MRGSDRYAAGFDPIVNIKDNTCFFYNSLPCTQYGGTILPMMKYLMLLSLLAINSSYAGVYAYNTWPHNEVTTCFAIAKYGPAELTGYKLELIEWRESEKLLLRKWVNEEFSSERTGIHFTGFQDCEVTPNADVILFRNKNSKFLSSLTGGVSGLGTLGYDSQGVLEGNPYAHGEVIISTTGMNKKDVTHEFGHIAGLAHEHEHPDAYKYEMNCRYTERLTKPQYNLRYEPFDRDSVMSYCSNTKGLSPKDVALLKKIYP